MEFTKPSAPGANGDNALGGIIDVISSTSVFTGENFVNASTCSLTATTNARGVIGMSLVTNAINSNFVLMNTVNSMTGDITIITDSGGAGGIFGISFLGTTSYKMNVMRSDITPPNNAGGIAGVYFDGSVTNAIVTMYGNVSGADVSTSLTTGTLVNTYSGTISVEWATSDFGMTLLGSSVSDTGSIHVASGSRLYHPDLPEIPYMDMSATDSESNINVDTPFPNIGGHSTLYDGTYDYYVIGYERVDVPSRCF